MLCMQFLPRANYHFTEESRSFHEMHKTTVEIVSVESDCFVWAPLYLKDVWLLNLDPILRSWKLRKRGRTTLHSERSTDFFFCSRDRLSRKGWAARRLLIFALLKSEGKFQFTQNMFHTATVERVKVKIISFDWRHMI